MAGTRIPPISCIGTMACWQDWSTVFECHSEDFWLIICSQFQLISYRWSQQIAWRHLAFFWITAYALHRFITTTIGILAVNIEAIAEDSHQSRHTSRINARVTNGSYGWNIRHHSVLTAISFWQKSLESVANILLIIEVKIIPAHLIYYNSYNQLRPINLCMA